jgi:hypothetical protein
MRIHGILLLAAFPPKNLNARLHPTEASIKAAAERCSKNLDSVRVDVDHVAPAPGESFGRVVSITGSRGVMTVTLELTPAGVEASSNRPYFSAEYTASLVSAGRGKPKVVVTEVQAVSLVAEPGLRGTAWSTVYGDSPVFVPSEHCTDLIQGKRSSRNIVEASVSASKSTEGLCFDNDEDEGVLSQRVFAASVQSAWIVDGEETAGKSERDV